jgi:hypothetical protein
MQTLPCFYLFKNSRRRWTMSRGDSLRSVNEGRIIIPPPKDLSLTELVRAYGGRHHMSLHPPSGRAFRVFSEQDR